MKWSSRFSAAAFAWAAAIDIAAAQRGHLTHVACPAACSEVGRATIQWPVYSSIDRLTWCNETMLVSFNVHNALDNPDTHSRLAVCTASRAADQQAVGSLVDYSSKVSRRSNTEAKRSSSDISAGNSTGILQNATATVQVQSVSSGTSGHGHLTDDLVIAAHALLGHVGNGSEAEHNILFAYSNGVVVGVYSGEKVKSSSTADLLHHLLDKVQESKADTSVVEVCGQGRNGQYAMGAIAVAGGSGANSLRAAQKAVASWSHAKCVAGHASTSSSTSVMTVQQVADTPVVNSHNSTKTLVPRGWCLPLQVHSGDDCAYLATRCGISGADFMTFNPNPNECSTLVPGEWVCCTAGDLPDMAPPPNADGSCHSYYVQNGDTCSQIAATNSLTVTQLESYNSNTWGWMGCADLWADMNICLSTGTPPMPAPIPNAICGPQVPGTSPPPPGFTLSQLNSCPLNACCDMWGQCGITADFCTASSASTGAPGTAAPGQNGCISNCGTDIVNHNVPPASYMNIGYFEAFNLGRSCLNMGVDEIPAGYSHVHFAFGNITSGFQVDVSGAAEQFQLFVAQKSFKRILSFGGWTFSTDPSTYNIFRQAMQDPNRATLVASMASWVREYGLDGIDIDWEYPGEPDIQGIPPDNQAEGLYFLGFLMDLRSALPPSASLSITAPSSYWYLRAYPIDSIASVVDYIVFMTYDLHGQWDYGNKWTNPGCPTGNCLRSHVNITETLSALSMITKAGVPTNKIAVGVASHARSFGMVDPGCTGVECLFTGPLSGAQPGPCTQTAGYISVAEVNQILADPNIPSRSWFDYASDSNIVTWGSTWAAYMDQTNKNNRRAIYGLFNFAGTADWAIDLQEFVAVDPNELLEYTSDSDWRTHSCDDPALSLSNPSDVRWATAGSDGAWYSFIDHWNTSPNPYHFSFCPFMGDFYVHDQFWNCGVFANQNGCTPENCDNANNYPPGAAYVQNSIYEIYSMNYDLYSAIRYSLGNLTAVIGAFGLTFSPPINDASGRNQKLLIDALSLGFALAVAPIWNVALNGVQIGIKGDVGWLKDTINPLVSNGATLTKDAMSTIDPLSWNFNITDLASKITGIWASSLSNTHTQLFNGSPQSISQLFNMIDNGHFLGPLQLSSEEQSIQAISTSLFAMLIPRAWDLRGEWPFIMDTGLVCGIAPSQDIFDSLHLDATTADASRVCYNGKLYHLLAFDPLGPQEACASPEQLLTGCPLRSFAVPTGTNTLDGRTWGTLTFTDFVTSVLDAYTSNGNKNGWTPPDPSDPNTLDSVINSALSNTLPAGIVILPVCGPDVAWQNWVNLRENGFVPPPNYPCS